MVQLADALDDFHKWSSVAPAWLLIPKAERKSTGADRSVSSSLRSPRLCKRAAASAKDDEEG